VIPVPSFINLSLLATPISIPGVSHKIVSDDQAGVAAIMDWLSFVPATAEAPPRELKSADPFDREVDFMPTKVR